MRPHPLAAAESGRLVVAARPEHARYVSPPGANFGVFELRTTTRITLHVISSGTDLEFGWEHVSVHAVERAPQGTVRESRTPSWAEMCFVKNLFWGPEECVVQFHPASSEYVNFHEFTLHLWRPLRDALPTPPRILV